MVDPFAIVYIDWITKLPKTSDGNKKIVCIDALTKWIEVKAYSSATSLNSANFLLEQIVFRFGALVLQPVLGQNA